MLLMAILSAIDFLVCPLLVQAGSLAAAMAFEQFYKICWNGMLAMIFLGIWLLSPPRLSAVHPALDGWIRAGSRVAFPPFLASVGLKNLISGLHPVFPLLAFVCIKLTFVMWMCLTLAHIARLAAYLSSSAVRRLSLIGLSLAVATAIVDVSWGLLVDSSSRTAPACVWLLSVLSRMRVIVPMGFMLITCLSAYLLRRRLVQCQRLVTRDP